MGNGNKPTAGIDALAETRDRAAPHEGIDPSVDNVSDQETRRVRAEIDCRYTHRDSLRR